MAFQVGVASAEILSKHAKPSNIAFLRVRFCRFIRTPFALRPILTWR
jgi:hypothetical protein